MPMKETQNAASLDSESVRSKETNELNYSRMGGSPKAFEAMDRDDSSNCKITDDFSVDNENGKIDSPTREGQNELSHHQSAWDKDADSLSSDSCDIDREQSSPEHGSSRENADSPCTDASDMYRTDANLFTDKNVLKCELPELEVCYQEIDCQILKDICVDEGRHERDINVIASCNDEKPGYLFPQPPNESDQFEAKEDSSADQCGSMEENDGKMLVSQGRLETSIENSSEKDTSKHCDLGDSLQTGEAKRDATGKAETDSSEEETLVGRELPFEDSGEENKVLVLPDQIVDEIPVFDHPAASAEAGGSGKDVKMSSLSYNSKVESQSITFNFKPPVPEVVDNGITVNVDKQSGSEDLPNDVNAENLSDAVEVQCTTNTMENDLEQSPKHEDTTNSNDSSTDGPVQVPSNVQAVEPNVPQHERRNSGNVSVVSRLQHDEGETSFSAASLINYSGPIAFSGSLSHRSDGSTTSTKSFAFPVLQSEWNSSPVRMAKADRRHFRKQKGWRSGLLCCRF